MEHDLHPSVVVDRPDRLLIFPLDQVVTIQASLYVFP